MLKFWDWAGPSSSLVLLKLLMNLTVFCETTYFVQDQDQNLSWFQFSFKTNTKTSLEMEFFLDQYQEVSWFFIPVKTNTKTSLDIGNDSRPIPILVLILEMIQDQYQESWLYTCLRPIPIPKGSRLRKRVNIKASQRLRKWPPPLPNHLTLPHPLGRGELKTSSEDKSLLKLNTT